MGTFQYDTGLVAGSVITVSLICYVAISIQQLLKQLAEKYNFSIMFIVALLFGTPIWIVLIGILFVVNVVSIQHFQPSLLLFSYIVNIVASFCAVWTLKQKKVHLIGLFLIASVLSLGYCLSFEFAARASADLQIFHPVSLTVQLRGIFLTACGLALSLWLLFKLNLFRSTALVRILISVLFSCSIVALQYMYLPSAQGRGTHAYLSGYSPLLVWNMLIFLSVAMLVVSLFHWFAWGLTHLETSLLKTKKKLNHLNQHDQLTLLPNREYLNLQIKRIFEEHRQHKQNIVLLSLNLDRFKAINDAFGYHIGDELLVVFTQRINAVLTQYQMLYRLGADEFLCVAERSSREQAEQLAQQLLDAVLQPFIVSGRSINITTSIGIAVYPEHGQRLQELLMHSDIAMQEAKLSGRNTFHFFDYNLGQYEARHQSKLINDLFIAIEKKQFILFYQPKFSCDGKVCGAEALIRWQHPKLGLLAPNMFIPIAEATGLIIPLGYWVMEQACQQIQEWESKHLEFYPLAINLSTVQIEHKDLIPKLQTFITEYSIRSEHLIIEITESTAMHNFEFSIDIFHKIRALGVKLSIDDFGTGHSSFVYLKDLPVNELKIDRAFIQNLSVGSKDEVVLASLIQLTKNLGLTVTAEGVETKMQFDILKTLGCEQLQGFLFGKPMPKEVFESQLLRKMILK